VQAGGTTSGLSQQSNDALTPGHAEAAHTQSQNWLSIVNAPQRVDDAPTFLANCLDSIMKRGIPSGTKNKKQSPEFKKYKAKMRFGHGITMGIAFLALYPMAALMMRLFNFQHILAVHIGVQLFAMVLMYFGLGCGIWFSYYDGKLFNSIHTQMGVAIPALMLVQPFLGWLHHRGYVKSGGRTIMTFIHANYGRILVFLGGVNAIIGRVNEKGDYAQ
jgi:hypothetical protein